METKLIVRKDDIAKHGNELEDQLFQLAKVIRAEHNTWVLIPAENLKQLTRALEDKRVSYGIESEQEYIRERLR